jgi:hypothetical protein
MWQNIVNFDTKTASNAQDFLLLLLPTMPPLCRPETAGSGFLINILIKIKIKKIKEVARGGEQTRGL